MHPETQLQVAQVEHRLRVVEATRVVSVLRAIAQRCAQQLLRSTDVKPRDAKSGGSPCHPDAVPRWAM